VLHKTYGVYPNGSWKRNAVEPGDLQAHIQYNKDWRWGRALIVDGKVEYNGYFRDEEIQAFVKDKLPKIDADWHPVRATIPYQ
jgi:hypothetical protein